MSTIDDVMGSIKGAMFPIHREGRMFIGIAAAITLAFALFSTTLFWIGLIITCWVAFFFRDPKRIVPMRAGLVVSPADGKVVLVDRAVPPVELGLGTAPLPRVAIFLSVFNVHINRSPIAGRIARIAYRPGKFLNADMDKASEDNERNGLAIETPYGMIGVVQIAGLVARRILCFSIEGSQIATGERFGLIRFGSRVDLYLPEGTTPRVGLGQLAFGGETIIADLGDGSPSTTWRND
ncbi:phosphatidylserine decarboxylase proenzyme [Agaricicola taiwanensis]|uniref:Phosphatidylserine decarboxylase proenzyme n=1 Tax=Agaricicola taiwanensis TaxID=591372 RepID=A0A8J2YGT2_9RHOB|nr:phosphatidylserine decarboxylase [Agaricicola taiwanensis]GGE37717.1 phosphatidylserine decarboxylase proenzyme [Agaricicola taiwanensis]